MQRVIDNTITHSDPQQKTMIFGVIIMAKIQAFL